MKMEEIEKVKYAVEANSYEILCLWKEWHEHVEWKQISSGRICEVGKIKDIPVMVQLFWNVLDGHKILFYSPCSRMVDHEMINNWLKKNALMENAIIKNSMNFGNIVNKIR